MKGPALAVFGLLCEALKGGPLMHAGMDLGRNSMAVALVADDGEVVDEFSVRPTVPWFGRSGRPGRLL